MAFIRNPDGSISFDKGNNVFYNLFGQADIADNERYALEYNEALRQYNQNYQLQKDTFDLNKQNMQFNQQLQQDTFNLNKQNMQFNQDLSQRQQALAEESYYNSTINQARQLAKLGINPASQGGSVSGQSMAGGSGVSGVDAGYSPDMSTGYASGRNPSAQIHNWAQNRLTMLSTLLDFIGKKASIDVSEKNAESNRINAEANMTSAKADEKNADTNRSVAHSTITLNAAKTAAEMSKNDYQRMVNESYRKSEDIFSGLGMSTEFVEAAGNINPKTAAVLGVFTIFGNSNADSNWVSDPTISDANKEQQIVYVEKVVNAYEVLDI